MKKVLSLLVTTVLIFSMVGCAHNPANDPTHLTSFQRVVQWNTALAEANRDVAKAVIAAQKSNSITVDNAAKLLIIQEKIAEYDKQITVILKAGPDAATGNRAAILDLISKVKATTQDLLSDYNVTNSNLLATEVGLVLTTATDIFTIVTQTGAFK